jgi:hypothetical protein
MRNGKMRKFKPTLEDGVHEKTLARNIPKHGLYVPFFEVFPNLSFQIVHSHNL